jgi:hypothetical protein
METRETERVDGEEKERKKKELIFTYYYFIIMQRAAAAKNKSLLLGWRHYLFIWMVRRHYCTSIKKQKRKKQTI